MRRVLLLLLLLLPLGAKAQAPAGPPPTYGQLVVCADSDPITPRLLFRDHIASGFGGTLLTADRSDQFQTVDRRADGRMLALGSRWANDEGGPGRERVWIVLDDGGGSVRRALVSPPAPGPVGGWEIRGGFAANGGAILVAWADGRGVWWTALDRNMRIRPWRRLDLPADTTPAHVGIDPRQLVLSGALPAGSIGPGGTFRAVYDLAGRRLSLVAREPYSTPYEPAPPDDAAAGHAGPAYRSDRIAGWEGAENEKDGEWSALVDLRATGDAGETTLAFRLPAHGWRSAEGVAADSSITLRPLQGRPGAPPRLLLHRSIGDFDIGRFLADEYWILQPTAEPHCRKLDVRTTLGRDRAYATRAEPQPDGGILLHGWGFSAGQPPSRDRVVWIGYVVLQLH